MGAPKQKWTAEEEAALKAGIDKHGTGKWRTILKDPEFSHILYLRSNVDLKDKWRNMGVATNGLASHERTKVSRKRSTPAYKHDDDDFSPSPVEEDFDDEPVDSRPIPSSYKKSQITGPNKSSPRLENLVVEAITNLNEPAGSSMMTIAMYIEDHYWSPQDFESMLSMKLKMMTASGKLVKVKCKYRIAPTMGFSEQRDSMTLPLERKQKFFSGVESTPVRSQIDAEIAKMRNMTSLEAAAAAARAMAEAEVAMAEAEEAAREAEIAEADAEEAQAFAETALLTLKNRSTDGSSFQEIRGQ